MLFGVWRIDVTRDIRFGHWEIGCSLWLYDPPARKTTHARFKGLFLGHESKLTSLAWAGA